MSLKIILLEPFFSGSHRQWAVGFQKYSQHKVDILSLPGRHWKWRMHGGAISLAKQFNALDYTPDLILATSMLDLTTFLSLTRKKSAGIPVHIYFHENQLTYPWSPQDRDVKNKRNNHYAFINYASALSADKVFFNSEYHRNSFLEALPAFLNQFPDKQGKENIEAIRNKSKVLYLGMDLSRFDAFNPVQEPKEPMILWNHRWEYDKRPKAFYSALYKLKEKGFQFKLIVLGERNEMIPKSFEEAKEKLSDEIINWGYAKNYEEYAKWLWKADILPVTSKQDFFGGSVVEAMYCNCFPLLPNRLAYPEHLSNELKAVCLYEEGELFEKLMSLILKMNETREMSFQSLVNKYDWKVIIEKYDEALNN
ncbi:MAG: DUF3524 domain-containing protein [Balneolaceae bacterium]